MVNVKTSGSDKCEQVTWSTFTFSHFNEKHLYALSLPIAHCTFIVKYKLEGDLEKNENFIYDCEAKFFDFIKKHNTNYTFENLFLQLFINRY